MRRSLGLVFGLLMLTAVVKVIALRADDPAASKEFFETKIRPVLATNCFACHTSAQSGDLRVDSRAALLKGGSRGPAITPGDPEKSLLITALRQADDSLKMPLGGKLKDSEIDDIAAWIKAGAPKDLAHAVALYRPLAPTVTLADLARRVDWPVTPTARIYHAVGGAFGFDRLRAAAGARPSADAYERLAVRRLIEDMLAEQAALAQAVIAYAGRPDAGETHDAAKAAVASWSGLHAEAVRFARDTIGGIEKEGGGWSFAKLTIANAALRELA